MKDYPRNTRAWLLALGLCVMHGTEWDEEDTRALVRVFNAAMPIYRRTEFFPRE